MPGPALASVIGAVIVALVVSGCASVPTGPSVMVMPGTGKSFETFQVDDAVCRQWAAQQTGITTSKAATESTVGGAGSDSGGVEAPYSPGAPRTIARVSSIG